MPLAAPPGPLWTADAKEPHPVGTDRDGPPQLGAAMLGQDTDTVRRPDDGAGREQFRPAAGCSAPFLENHAAQHRAVRRRAAFNRDAQTLAHYSPPYADSFGLTSFACAVPCGR